MAYDATVKMMLGALERNILPDIVIRKLTRVLLGSRLQWGYKPTAHQQISDLLQFVQSIKEMDIAVETDKPKSQHYELPTSFFKLVLGENMKYSCCYFDNTSDTLEDAERKMLELYCERSQIEDGHTILDVGCGWGSLSLYVAKKYPNCRVTGICNSTTQKEFIEDRCRNREVTRKITFYRARHGHWIYLCCIGTYNASLGERLDEIFDPFNNILLRNLNLSNVKIIAADISTFEMEATFDRIISIEMFEHMKNYQKLLLKISKWMHEDSLLFVHYFCHKTFSYHFEDTNDDDWITRYFFTGGTMPSANLLLYFQDDLSIVNHWLVNGKHYSQTSEEWLKRMDKNISLIKPVMESTYGKDDATKWTVYWRTFFIAVAELFGYNNGEEWMVAHFLFKKK